MRFRIGDRVRYELSWWGKPRWIGNRDRGGSGHWEDGEVVEVSETELTVEGRTGRSIWPLDNHRHYDFLQWSWAGFVQLIEPREARSPRKCVCGAEAVYGAGCTVHSHWCDMAA